MDIAGAMPVERPCSPRRKLSQAKAKDLECAKEIDMKNSPQKESLAPDVLRKLHITIPVRAEDKMPSARKTSESFVTQVMANFSK
ncbi:hypothetical protein THRCLA_22825 [Thraustotheca clavata]|uniref:Uncharacterized protein n=1 Tax=Thraustotheca clavata TaxID=74557 RepID=A0A1V9YSC8_9STRA|nr:hypothetical protein THRCLA_22825 [Thraustotheca clavata]